MLWVAKIKEISKMANWRPIHGTTTKKSLRTSALCYWDNLTINICTDFEIQRIFHSIHYLRKGIPVYIRYTIYIVKSYGEEQWQKSVLDHNT